MTAPSQARNRALLLLITSSLALAGCATSHGLHPAATLPNLDRVDAGNAIGTAAATADGGDTDGSERWWKSYRDPQLDDLIERALADAPSMAVAQARIAQADAMLGVSRADIAPQVTGSGQASGEYFPDRYVYPAPWAGDVGSQAKIGADARYHLDFWGKHRKAVEAAGARVEAAHEEARDATLVLQSAVVMAYVRLDAAYRTRDIASAGLNRRQGVLDLLALRTRAGLATDIDAVQARQAITATRSEIARLDGEIAVRCNEIAALLGKGPGFGDAIRRPGLIHFGDPAPTSAIPASLLGHRPDVAAQRARIEAAAKEIGVARAAFYPEVDLTGFAGIASLGIANLFRARSGMAGGGAAITLPIFDGGRLRGTLRARNAGFDEAVASYNATIAAALQQVADGIVLLRAERRRKDEVDQAVAHWRHVAGLQKTREKQGLASGVDRLSTETALLLAERDAAEADARIAVAQVSLIRALGGAWTSDTH